MDTIPDDTCQTCGAKRGEKHGDYRDTSGEWIPCEYEETMIECPCGWIGTKADLIAEWSGMEPHCPGCWNSRDFEDKEVIWKEKTTYE